MTDDDPPDAIPDSLSARLEELDEETLRAVDRYVQSRLAVDRPSLEELIEREAGEDVVEVTIHEGYALVKKPRAGESADAPLELYWVKREPEMSGDSQLEWKFLGRVEDD